MREYGRIHQAFCFEDRPLGKFTEWASTAVKSPDVEIPVKPGMTSVKTLCPCCVFWRGVLVGGIVGGVLALVVGVI